MVATVIIRNNKGYASVLSWLQENIGDLLHSKPIIFWHGNGWHMKLGREMGAMGIRHSVITVDFDNPEHATWFGLVWL
jgi:hypothetical protein